MNEFRWRQDDGVTCTVCGHHDNMHGRGHCWGARDCPCHGSSAAFMQEDRLAGWLWRNLTNTATQSGQP